MSLDTLALVLVAAVLHASWNLISKKAAQAGEYFVFAYRLVSIVIYLPWVVLVFLNHGMSWTPLTVAFIALSSLIHLGYGLSLQWGYRAADLSVVYPVARGTGPLLSSIGAFLWLGEQPSTRGIAGLLAVAAGILLIATQGAAHRHGGSSWIGIRWGLGIGSFIAAYTITDAYAVKALLVAPVVLDWLAACGNAALMAPRMWLRRATLRLAMREHWLRAVAVGGLSPLAYILVLLAH